MALVGTISGSNSTSASAVTGTLVVANVNTDFPSLPSDAVFFVSGGLDGSSKAVIGGELIVSGTIRSLYSAGAEGGELFLNKAATSTIAGGVTIDINGDRLRIFETEPPNRGGYFDITTLSNGVGTNLVGAGATPASPLNSVQFNDGGSFGGDADFTFNKTTNTVSAANLFVTGSGDSLVTSGSFIVKDASGVSNVVITPLGNITGSNALLTGDLAINGGDLTSTAATFNLATSIGTQLNVGGTTPVIEIGTFGGSSTTRLGYGQTVSPAVKTIEIGTRGNTGSTTNITLGVNVAGVLGRITMNQDVALTTGNIIGAPGTGANVLTLVSSGNIVAKLDTDGSAPGHRFEVQDNVGGVKFAVGEDGNAEVGGTLYITGSMTGTNALFSGDIDVNGGDINTTATTLNLNAGSLGFAFLRSASPFTLVTSGVYTTPGGTISANVGSIVGAAGKDILVGSPATKALFLSGADFITMNAGANGVQLQNNGVELIRIASGAGSNVLNMSAGPNLATANFLTNQVPLINIGSSTSTGSFGGDLGVTGRVALGGVLERMTHTQGGTSLSCDMINQSIFYLSNPGGNVTANFNNVPTTTNRIHTPTVILSQSATGRIVSVVQIGGVNQTILWTNGVTPTGNANKQDVFGFSLIRSGSVWTVLGQMSTYG